MRTSTPGAVTRKKRNTAVRATKPGVLHHPRGKHGQLLSRQSQCTPFQTTCLQGGGCCPNTKVCCLGVIAQGNCCDPGQICIGAKTCCDTNQTGCGEACCDAGQECCGLKCCNTGGGFQCTDSECVAVAQSTNSTLSTTSASLSSLSSRTRTSTSATNSSTTNLFGSSGDNSTTSFNLVKVTTIGGVIAGISIAVGVVVYLIRRNRQRRRLAEMQRVTQRQYFHQPQPPPNFVGPPAHQAPGTPWAQPTQVLPNPARIPTYYTDNSSTVNILSTQNQQQLYYASNISRQPSTTAHSEFSGGSSDYQTSTPQPWATPVSMQPQRVNTPPTNTPWTEGLGASGEPSGAALGRQNTKARYVTAAQREEAAWEAKRREAQAAGMSGAGVSNANASMHASVGSGDMVLGRSTTPANSARNGGSRRRVTDDLGPADPPIPGGVQEFPPPAYSEYQSLGGPQAI